MKWPLISNRSSQQQRRTSGGGETRKQQWNYSAELPRESSEHFSKIFSTFLARAANSDYSKFKINNIAFGKKDNDLPSIVITDYGELTDTLQKSKNELLQAERDNAGTTATNSSFDRYPKKSSNHNAETIVLRIDEHLFDIGLVNQIFDLIEKEKSEYHIIYLPSRVNTDDLTRASRPAVQIDFASKKTQDLVSKVQTLIDLVPESQAKLIQLPFGASHSWQDSKSSIKVDGLNDNYMNDMDEVRHAGGASRDGDADGKSPGFVAQPAVDYLCYSRKNTVTVATHDLDPSIEKQIHELVGQSDIVISLLPGVMYIAIAKACVDNGIDLVTASYISPEMADLNSKVLENDVTLLNEIGLDPGLDHVSTMQLIPDIREKSNNEEKIISFSSVGGELPPTATATIVTNENKNKNIFESGPVWRQITQTPHPTPYERSDRNDGNDRIGPSDPRFCEFDNIKCICDINIDGNGIQYDIIWYVYCFFIVSYVYYANEWSCFLCFVFVFTQKDNFFMYCVRYTSCNGILYSETLRVMVYHYTYMFTYGLFFALQDVL